MTPSFSGFSSELVKIAESTAREKSLYEKLKKESPVKVRLTRDAEPLGGGYFSPDDEAHIGISDKRFDTLAHEIGHAKNQETLWGRLIQSVPARLAFHLSPIAGLAAGHAMAKGKLWPLLIPAAAVTPLLLAEALATRTGKKTLEQVGAKHEEVEKYRQNLRTAFSTYLDTPLAATTLGAFSYLISRAARPA